MSIWWVNTGERFKAQIEAGALWCPNRTVSGNGLEKAPQWHWSIIQDVKEGEFVLVGRDGRIEGIAVAKQAALVDQPKPVTFPVSDNWHPIGWLLPIEFVKFDKPVLRNEMAAGLFRQRVHRSPFFINNIGVLEGNQVYFAEVPGADAVEFFERIRLELDNQRPGQLEAALIGSIGSESPSYTAAETTREAIIKARIGQGQFRQSLLDVWNGRCCATGLSETRLLRASHIVPWSQSSNEERLDPFNGLLLSPAYDAAFDAHLITLGPDGSWENIGRLNEDELKRAGLGELAHQGVRGLTSRHHDFLARHSRSALQKWGSQK